MNIDSILNTFDEYRERAKTDPDFKDQLANALNHSEQLLKERGFTIPEMPAEEFADVIGEDEEDTSPEESNEPEVEVPAEGEEEFCEKDKNPLKGSIKIHVHDDGSVGYDITETLNEMEIMGAARYVIRVFEELELKSIRSVLRRKELEAKIEFTEKSLDPKVQQVVNDLINNITAMGKAAEAQRNERRRDTTMDRDSGL